MIFQSEVDREGDTPRNFEKTSKVAKIEENPCSTWLNSTHYSDGFWVPE